jgi:hypothetical protein
MDQREKTNIQWLNVADWESRNGLQPVRVAAWRDKWPRAHGRACAVGGRRLARFRTDSILVLRVTFIDVPDSPARRKLHGSAPVLLFRSLPERKIRHDIPAATKFTSGMLHLQRPDLSKNRK